MSDPNPNKLTLLDSSLAEENDEMPALEDAPRETPEDRNIIESLRRSNQEFDERVAFMLKITKMLNRRPCI